jgi:hypothetical protein
MLLGRKDSALFPCPRALSKAKFKREESLSEITSRKQSIQAAA